MQNNRKLLQYSRLGIIMFMVIVFSIHPAFAAGGCTGAAGDTLVMFNEFFANLGRFLSWVWILLGNFAGVLMTNIMVYGEFMNLDSFLWKIRQMSRSVANYTLGFLFIYQIFKYIFSSGEKSPIGKIKDILIASVLVQTSWFLVMVLVDLSTIALATVSSFPAQVMSSNSEMLTVMKEQIGKSRILNDKNVVIINAFTDKYLEQDNTKWYVVQEGKDKSTDPKKTTIDSLLPKADNLGGVFLYLGFTALNAQEYVYSPMPSAPSCVSLFEKVGINLILGAGIFIVYSLALVLLIILLVMRLGYLWVFIALSPIIVLLAVVGDLKAKTGKLQSKYEILDLNKAIFLIFQPVIFAFWISVMFFVVLMFQQVLSRSISTSLSGGVNVSGGSTTSTERDVQTKINSSLEDAGIVSVYVREAGRSMKDVVLSLIVLFLMWQLVKLALTGTISGFGANSSMAKKMENRVDTAGDVLGGVGVIPTPKGRMGLNQVWNGDSSPLIDNFKGNIESEFKKRDKSAETINELMGWKNAIILKPLGSNEMTKLNSFVKTGNVKDYVDQLQKFKGEFHGLIFNNSLQESIKNLLIKCAENNVADVNEYMARVFGSPQKWVAIKEEITKNGNFKLDDILNDRKTFSAFYQNIFGETKNVPKSYEEFINKNEGKIYYTKSES